MRCFTTWCRKKVKEENDDSSTIFFLSYLLKDFTKKIITIAVNFALVQDVYEPLRSVMRTLFCSATKANAGNICHPLLYSISKLIAAHERTDGNNAEKFFQFPIIIPVRKSGRFFLECQAMRKERNKERNKN